jgi:MFS transporter, OPA family, glycerol-3-phosphate transporter
LPVGMAIGAVSNGWVSDRFFGSKRCSAITLYMVLASIAVLCMRQIPFNQVLLCTGTLFLCGFFVFGPQASFFALCPDLAGVKRAGTATGVLNFYSYLCAGLMEPFIGWLLDHHPDTGNVFLVVATASILSGIVAFFIKR